MKASKRILICPLDWGLGHASRCVPLVRYLLEQNHEVILAASGAPKALLEHEFPSLKIVSFEGYNIRYSNHFLWLRLLLQVPKILFGIYREHKEVNRICKSEKIEVLISDNRFGCWSSSCTNIFITHQIFIQAPLFQSLIRTLNFWCMKHYQQVWIPDVEKAQGYSGSLSHGNNLPAHARYIGLLSRFSLDEKEIKPEFQYKICVLLSGPEPQRTLLEEILLKQLEKLEVRTLVVRGLPHSKQNLHLTSPIQIENHMTAKELQARLLDSELVICRSGYSSIMDLAALGKKAIFIPTPGQTEQEYLAQFFKVEKIAYSCSQNDFDLRKALEESKNYKGFEAYSNNLDLSSWGL